MLSGPILAVGILQLVALLLVVVPSSCTNVGWTIEEFKDGENDIARELVQMLNKPEIASSLGALRGGWPFAATSRCSRVATRDLSYRDYVQKGRDDLDALWSIASCGRNVFTRDDDGGLRDSQQPPQKDTEDERDGADNVKDDLLKEFDDLIAAFDRHQSPRLRTRKRKSLEVHGDVSSKEGRVVGGHAVQDGAWPWLAAIGTKARGPKCGGSLIASRWILTAAHCFKDMEAPCEYNVRLGSRNWLTDSADTHVDATVEAIYRHPDYDNSTMANDIALLKLSEPVSLDQDRFINAICLPHQSRSVKPGTVCLAAGWGRIGEDSQVHVFESQEVEVNVLTYRNPCGDYSDELLQRGMVCVGDLRGGHDTCQGDSGGPLIYRAANRWTQLGITSFGEGCARAGYPGVYTDVGYHLNWIAAVLRRYSSRI